jgi:hypothetical protein
MASGASAAMPASHLSFTEGNSRTTRQLYLKNEYQSQNLLGVPYAVTVRAMGSGAASLWPWRGAIAGKRAQTECAIARTRNSISLAIYGLMY